MHGNAWYFRVYSDEGRDINHNLEARGSPNPDQSIMDVCN